MLLFFEKIIFKYYLLNFNENYNKEILIKNVIIKKKNCKNSKYMIC